MVTTIADLQAKHAAGQEMQRQVRMMHAWRAYYGEAPQPLKVRPGDVNDNVRLNFARLVVDKGVSFLFGRGVRFAVEEGGADAQRWLDRVWRANRQDTFLQRLAVNGGVCGHAWVKLRPPRRGVLPRLIALDPQQVTVLWEPDDYEDVVEYRLQWTGIDPRTGKAAAYRQLISRSPSPADRGSHAGEGSHTELTVPRGSWRITDQVSELGRSTWSTLYEGRWPWDWPPVIGCQNLPAPNEYFGVSDLEADLMDVSRSIDFTMSNIARILKFHAHPKTWVRGTGQAELGIDADGLIYLPTKTSEIGILEMESDLSSSLEFYKRLKEALHEMARIPEVATGKVEHLGALSGTALQVLYQPLIEKTQTKRSLYGEMLAEVSERLLEMGGFGGDAMVRADWPPMLPEEREKGGTQDA